MRLSNTKIVKSAYLGKNNEFWSQKKQVNKMNVNKK